MLKTTQQKLLFLLFTMLFGLATLSYLLYKHQNASEYHIKTLYFGSLLPVSNLKEILLLIEGDVALKVYEKRAHPENLEYLAFSLRKTDKKIMSLWKEYATRYKSKEEKAFVALVDLRMHELHNYILELAQKAVLLKAKDTGISFKNLSEGTEAINKLIKQLISYELQAAQMIRKDHVSRYERDQILLIVTILLLVLVMLGFFLPISNNIKHTEQKLKSTAVHLEQANKDLRLASITDGLTGLFNRRYFDQIFENEMLRAQREKASFSFMMLDIDHFKKYNDFYGHAAGDEVIKKVALHLGNYFKRPSDLIFRLGGEEFGIITVGSALESLSSLNQALVSEMQKLNIEHKKSETEAFVTLSMGMVHFPVARHMEPKALYELTDNQLYEAKEGGRNKVVEKVEA